MHCLFVLSTLCRVWVGYFIGILHSSTSTQILCLKNVVLTDKELTICNDHQVKNDEIRLICWTSLSEPDVRFVNHTTFIRDQEKCDFLFSFRIEVCCYGKYTTINVWIEALVIEAWHQDGENAHLFQGPFDTLVVLFFLMMPFNPALGKSAFEFIDFLDLNMITILR